MPHLPRCHKIWRARQAHAEGVQLVVLVIGVASILYMPVITSDTSAMYHASARLASGPNTQAAKHGPYAPHSNAGDKGRVQTAREQHAQRRV